jgi:hypothetical protein
MRFSMLVDLLSTCNTLFIWIHTLDKNIRIKLG